MIWETFEKWPRAHDPQALRTYVYRFDLAAGVTLTIDALDVLAGDGTTDTVDGATDLQLLSNGVAIVGDETHVWVRLTGGSALTNGDGTQSEKLYPIRLRYTLSNGDEDDRTMLLRVRNC